MKNPLRNPWQMRQKFTVDSQTAPLLLGIIRQFSGFIESNKKPPA